MIVRLAAYSLLSGVTIVAAALIVGSLIASPVVAVLVQVAITVALVFVAG